MVTTYTPHTRKHDLKSALLKHWNKIESNQTLNKLFPNPPLLAFKRARNLADLIVNSKLPKIETDKKPLHNQISMRGDNLTHYHNKLYPNPKESHDSRLMDFLNLLSVSALKQTLLLNYFVFKHYSEHWRCVYFLAISCTHPEIGTLLTFSLSCETTLTWHEVHKRKYV